MAIINSVEEEEIIKKLMADKKVIYAFIGFHDNFQKDDWVTVLDQPLNETGHLHWKAGEPNNSGNDERCGDYISYGDDSGINDENCRLVLAFICKIYLG